VGKYCSDVLHSFRAYGVVVNAVRTRVCVRAHVRSSRWSARSYTPMHTCMPTYQIQTRVNALHICLPTFIPVHSAIVYITRTNAPHYYAFMRADYVLHSRECLECRVVGKCCSNALRSLHAYGVVVNAVRTCVYEKSDAAHVRRSRCAIPYILCTALTRASEVWSCGQVLQQCAALPPPLWSSPQGCMHMRV
jgi:hypothetical protein